MTKGQQDNMKKGQKGKRTKGQKISKISLKCCVASQGRVRSCFIVLTLVHYDDNKSYYGLHSEVIAM